MDDSGEKLAEEMKRLRQMGDELAALLAGMHRHQVMINEFWIADEAEGICDILARMERETVRIIDELYEIERDMIKAYEESILTAE